jgi:hypothetical protein
MALDGTESNAVVRGPNRANAVAGAHFVAWLDQGEGVAAKRIGSAGEPVVVGQPVWVSARLAAAGDRLAWASYVFDSAGDPKPTIHITPLA